MTTEYCVVITYTVQSYGEGYKTREEAEKELKKEMKKYTSPNYSFQITKFEYENCTPEEWEEENTERNFFPKDPFKE